MDTKNYFVGLDMGTSSVGWAVTDENYVLLRAKGKDMWGIREFEEAQTSAERRVNRIARRRIQRQKVRTGLLRDLFKDEIDKVDPDFFTRLDNSFFFPEDKPEQVRYKNVVFNDADYKDADYKRDYPTIFHLIRELVENPKPHDVRLVYLAIHNIYAHRGHFLYENMNSENSDLDILEAYQLMRGALVDCTAESKQQICLPETLDREKFENIMYDRTKSRSVRKEALTTLFGIEKSDKAGAEVIKALCGLTADAVKLFGLELEDAKEKITFSFSDSAFEEKSGEWESRLGEEIFSAILLIKQVYDICAWNMVICGYNYLYESRIASYEEHKKDLSLLKELLRKYSTKKDYVWFFRSTETGTYGDYTASNCTKGKKSRRVGNHKREDFYKEVKKLLQSVPDCEEKTRILQKIDDETFMPKQLTGANGIIPYQAHLKELKAIIDNAVGYLPFLREKTNDCDLTVAEQIVQIFSFKIPYYIGPMSGKSSQMNGNGWVVRREEGKVLPWNMEQKIDLKKTSEEFIKRLIRKCTYISGESVLPKASLIYERYTVLNVLNTIGVDGVRIPVEVKQEMYWKLFAKGKKVSLKSIISFLKERNLFSDDSELTGIDVGLTHVNNTLVNYAKFVAVFGEENMKLDRYYEMAENVIFWCTVYGDSRSFLKQQLEEKYADVLDEQQIKRILGFKFKDWGQFSKEFLQLNGVEKQTGELLTLSEALWKTQYNMMELINSDKYTFAEELAAKSHEGYKLLNDITIEDLNEMYFSAPVRRMVWQTLLILREIEQIMGCAPQRVFVEMTRGEDKKKERTISRKQKFLDLYKKVKDESNNWAEVINQADSNGKIRSKKMFLYLTQQGKDMYTGKPIPLEKLFDDNLYDIDHLYPQSLVKDDSLDNNMVLVNKKANNERGNRYPIPISEEFKTTCHALWKSLQEKGFITVEKYHRLTSRNELSDEQLEGFIARQIVETGQGTKAVADILKNALPDTKVIYSKAKVVSDFRQKFGFVKCRSINDFHHANDAYLNIVVGNAYYSKFTDNPRNYIKTMRKKLAKEQKKYDYNLAKFFENDVDNAWVGCGKQREDGTYEEKGTIITVKKMMSKNTPILSRMSFVGHGGFSDQTRSDAVKARGNGYVSFKGNDPRMKVERYGGFKNAATAYFFLVEHDMKKKRIRTVETVPIYLVEKIEKHPEYLEDYCKTELGLVNPVVRLAKIKNNALIYTNGFFLHITGKSDNRLTLRNATNIILEGKWTTYAKKIDNSIENKRLDDNITGDENIAFYDELTKKHCNGIFKNRPNPIGEKLRMWRENFAMLSLDDQVKVLEQIIAMSAIAPDCYGNMEILNGGKKLGCMKISKVIDSSKGFLLINQSITGLYKKVIDLATV